MPLIEPTVFADLPGVFAAFTTRRFAPPGRDAAEAAAARLAEAEGFAGIALTEQVHEARVAVVSEAGRVAGHDGLVTRQPGLMLATVAADCALVLFADADARAVGACHAGWRGAVAGIVGETMARLAEVGASASRVHAFVGPCISLEAFEVGEEVAAEFEPEFVARRPEWPRPHVDLRAAVASQLREAGIAASRIEVSDACTVRQPGTFYSYRGEDGTAGRMLGLIGMRPS